MLKYQKKNHSHLAALAPTYLYRALCKVVSLANGTFQTLVASQVANKLAQL